MAMRGFFVEIGGAYRYIETKWNWLGNKIC